jgi:hypothetical protein
MEDDAELERMARIKEMIARITLSDTTGLSSTSFPLSSPSSLTQLLQPLPTIPEWPH